MLDYDKLKNIEKPARYIGGEANQIIKKTNDMPLRVAIASPDVYEVGMLDFNMKSTYYILNKRKDVWCERVFAPMKDFENLLKSHDEKLYTLESKTSLKSMDMIMFFPSSELLYTNMMNMLNLSGIPIIKDRRQSDFPFVIAEMNKTVNPVVLEKFIDIFVFGELPEIVDEIVDKYNEWKVSTNTDKSSFYNYIKDINGVYIPKIHKEQNIKIQMVKNTGPELERFPKNSVVPYILNNTSDNIVRLTKGCKRNCRNCAFKYVYGQYFEKDIEEALKHVQIGTKNTGSTDILLMSNCYGDYYGFPEIIYSIKDMQKPEAKNVSVGEVKLNKENLWMLKYITNKEKFPNIFVGGANKKLRDVLGVEISDDEILEISRKIFESDFTKISIQYIIGIPGENYEDLIHIINLAEKITKIYSKVYSKMPNKYIVEVKLYSFHANAGTPMQWCSVNSLEKIELKSRYLIDKNKNSNICFVNKGFKQSILKTILSRGDIDVGKVVYEAWKQGARFDNIEELLNYDAWQIAFNKVKVDMKKYLEEIQLSEVLAWDNIEMGSTKEELKQEYIGGINKNESGRD